MYEKVLKQEDGAQVVEDALIISMVSMVSMVSIGLVLALQPSTIAASFSNFIGRVATCLTTGPCV